MATARFECDAKTLLATQQRMDARAFSLSDSIVIDGYNEHYSIAYGDRQQIMFLIGAIADEGNDYLLAYQA